jgi:hypothetical protein
VAGCCEHGNGSSGFVKRGEYLDLILSTDQEMVRARNVIDTHAQGFVANDALLQSILSTFAHCSRSLDATRTAWCCQFVWGSSYRLLLLPNSSPVVFPVCNSPSHRTKHAYHPGGDHLLSCGL